MRFLSRATALVLCLSLVLSVVPFSAAALTEGDFTYEIADDGSAVITAYSGSDEAVTVPATIGDLSVTAIGERAFASNNSMTSLSLPNTLKTIADNAFNGCINLTAVTIPASVVTIGSMAFYNCLSLQAIEIGVFTYDIGYQAFHNTAWFRNAEDGVLYLGRVLYAYVGSMATDTELTVKDGTAAIAPYAFSGRKNLKAIYLPVGIRAIGGCAFLGCSSLMMARIPPSVTTLGNGVFSNSGAVTVYTIPDTPLYSYLLENDTYYQYDETLDYPDGDINKDKLINSKDFRLMMLVLTDPTVYHDHERLLSCDAVYDGTIDTADLRALLLASVGL